VGELLVPPFPLSSFQQTQVTLELRFEEAFVLWDTTGALWETVRRQFKTLKQVQISANQTAFNGDNRFALVVSLDRAVITDHKPSGGATSTFDVMSKFTETVLHTLRVTMLKRVGTRFIYSLRCKDAEDARAKLAKALPLSFGGTEFFNVKPKRAAPLLKIDVGDGELGYTVQLNSNERKYEFSPPPEVSALNLELHDEAFHELVLDFDFFTAQPMPTESLDIRVWLSGWNKAIGRDADKLLDRLASLE
jgi:hypothetical protein